MTSSSAEKILAQLPMDRKIIFAPDKNLGAWFNRKTGRDMLLVARRLHRPRGVLARPSCSSSSSEYPDAPVAAHPECPAFILDHADEVGSTRAILDFALTSARRETIIVATEPHIIHQMEKAAPHKTLHRGAGGGRQLQLQHVPVHGAQHDGEALPRVARHGAPVIELDEATRHRRQEAARPDAGDGGQDRGAGGCRATGLASPPFVLSEVKVRDPDETLRVQPVLRLRSGRTEWMT